MGAKGRHSAPENAEKHQENKELGMCECVQVCKGLLEWSSWKTGRDQADTLQREFPGTSRISSSISLRANKGSLFQMPGSLLHREENSPNYCFLICIFCILLSCSSKLRWCLADRHDRKQLIAQKLVCPLDKEMGVGWVILLEGSLLGTQFEVAQPIL